MNPVEVILRKYDNKFITAQQGYFVLRSTPEIQEKSLVIGLIDLKRYRFKDYVLEDLLRKLNGSIGVPLFCFNTNHTENVYRDGISNVFGNIHYAAIINDVLYAKLKYVQDISSPTQRYNIPMSDDINITMKCEYRCNPRPIVVSKILGFHLTGS